MARKRAHPHKQMMSRQQTHGDQSRTTASCFAKNNTLQGEECRKQTWKILCGFKDQHHTFQTCKGTLMLWPLSRRCSPDGSLRASASALPQDGRALFRGADHPPCQFLYRRNHACKLNHGRDWKKLRMSVPGNCVRLSAAKTGWEQ